MDVVYALKPYISSYLSHTASQVTFTILPSTSCHHPSAFISNVPLVPSKSCTIVTLDSIWCIHNLHCSVFNWHFQIIVIEFCPDKYKKFESLESNLAEKSRKNTFPAKVFLIWMKIHTNNSEIQALRTLGYICVETIGARRDNTNAASKMLAIREYVNFKWPEHNWSFSIYLTTSG